MATPAAGPLPPSLDPPPGSIAYLEARRRRNGDAVARATPADVFELAHTTWLSGQRVDMAALAAQLKISRATLYRWTGHRDRLLGEIILASAEDLFERAEREVAHLAGSERILAKFRLNTGRMVRSPALRSFLQNETHAALRILTSRGGVVQPGIARLIAADLRAEEEKGTLRPRLEVDVLAYAIVRVTEGFIYNDAIAAIEPEVETAARVVEVMLE
jgi:AcrR family transcriptional regulator